MNKIPLIRPYITQAIKDRVCEVLDSGYLTEGPVTRQFEQAFAAYVGCRHVLAVTSCTAGLEVALRALGIGPGDEVIVPDYTYPATASVVSIVGAVPVIVDVDPATMLIDYDAVEQAITARTRAVIPVSLFGNPLDYERLNAIKRAHGMYLVEDAACAIGAEYREVKVGRWADISVFSLHPRKFITTGEGGMIATDNDQWAAWMESYKHFGMGCAASREGTVFERVGANYKLSNILAAVGLGQMQEIEVLLARRIELATNYLSLLRNISGVEIPATTFGGKHSFQSFCVFVNDRDRIMQEMRATGIEVQIGTYALHMHPAFAPGTNMLHHGAFGGSRYAFDHCLTLPLFHGLTGDDQQCVVDLLAKLVTT